MNFQKVGKKLKACSILGKPRRCSLVICKSLDMLIESVSFLRQGSNEFFTQFLCLEVSCLQQADKCFCVGRGPDWKYMMMFYAGRWNLPPQIQHKNYYWFTRSSTRFLMYSWWTFLTVSPKNRLAMWSRRRKEPSPLQKEPKDSSVVMSYAWFW